MNKHLAKGDKLNRSEIGMNGRSCGQLKPIGALAISWAGLLGAMLMCASTQVAAQVCAAERQAARAAYPNAPVENLSMEYKMEEINREIYSGYRFMPDRCEGSLRPRCQAALADKASRQNPNSLAYAALLNLYADVVTSNAEKYPASPTDSGLDVGRRLNICYARNAAVQLRPASGDMAGNSGPASSASSATSNTSATSSQEAQRLTSQINESIALAQQRQGKVDRARQGKPKRHVAGVEAHHCLKPQAGLHYYATNQCPYAVEYYYCVFHPEKGSWSEGVDCEKGKFGGWQVEPGPGKSSFMLSNGEITYWFACKYGSTLNDPDGISPADITFDPGRGMLGRCAEWGAKRS